MSTHPREEFDGWARQLELRDWSYIVDDFDTSYSRGEWYPYSKSVRLAPDVDYRAWRNEYVLVSPSKADAQLATARLTLITRPQGMGAMTVVVSAVLDMRTGEVTLSPDDLTGQLREEALTKAHRILQLFAAERARRDGRPRCQRPETAADRYERERTARTVKP